MAKKKKKVEELERDFLAPTSSKTTPKRKPTEFIPERVRVEDLDVRDGLPLTLLEFMNSADPIEVTINGEPVFIQPKQFNSGRFGWHSATKHKVIVGGTVCKIQVGICMTVIASSSRGK